MNFQEFCREYGISEWDPRSEIYFRTWEDSLPILSDQEYEKEWRRVNYVPPIENGSIGLGVLFFIVLLTFICLLQASKEPARNNDPVPVNALTDDYWNLIDSLCPE